MNPNEPSPLKAAFPAKDIARAIVKNRELMDWYKEAGRANRVHALSCGGRNWVILEDAELLEELRRVAKGLREYQYDESSGEVSELGQPR